MSAIRKAAAVAGRQGTSRFLGMSPTAQRDSGTLQLAPLTAQFERPTAGFSPSAPYTASLSPTRVTRVVNQGDRLSLKFADGEEVGLTSEWLRVNPPASKATTPLVIRLMQCDATEEAAEDTLSMVTGQREVRITEVRTAPFGLELTFSDRSEPKFYSFHHIRNLHKNKWPLMRNYIAGLNTEGYSRESFVC